MPQAAELERALSLGGSERARALVDVAQGEIADRALGGGLDASAMDALRAALVDVLQTGTGDGHLRLALGEVLGQLGDPRLRSPDAPEYWVSVPMDDGSGLLVGRHPVTNQEFQQWVTSGGYAEDRAWSEEGLAWRNSGDSGWPDLANDPKLAHLVVPNQPVVGVNWYEAEAYARAHGARLPDANERKWIVRGSQKRPYPWGQPFGEGNANTQEEALRRPCAVGLYVRDATPEGVTDLAGNVAEWLEDFAGIDERLYQPGSFSQPSMASWAKAVQLAGPEHRAIDLGFRLARDT